MGKGLILAAVLLLSGCETSQAPMSDAMALAVTKKMFCDVNQPRRPSRSVVAMMSRAELDDMNAYNAKGTAWCGWQP